MPEEIEEYEYITAVVDCGNLYWEYRIKGADRPGKQSHDEDVEHFSEEDIIGTTMTMLSVPSHQRDLIKIEYA